MSWFTGAADGLQEALIENEVRRRQQMLDAIAAEDRQDRKADREDGRAIQREQLAAAKESREQAAEKAKFDKGLRFRSALGTGQKLDDTGASMLKDAGFGGEVENSIEGVDAQMNVQTGLPTALGGGVPASTAPAAVLKMIEGQRFRGTPEQLAEQKTQEQQRAFIASLPEGSPERRRAEMRATGLTTGANDFNEDKGEIVGNMRQGTWRLRSDGSRTPILPPVAEKPAPVKDRVSLLKNPDGSVELVNIDKGTSTTVKQGETPAAAEARMEREAAARSRGTAAGKATAGGDKFSLIGTIGSMLGGGKKDAAGGTVAMVDKDGKPLSVPAADVAAVEALGGRRK